MTSLARLDVTLGAIAVTAIAVWWIADSIGSRLAARDARAQEAFIEATGAVIEIVDALAEEMRQAGTDYIPAHRVETVLRPFEDPDHWFRVYGGLGFDGHYRDLSIYTPWKWPITAGRGLTRLERHAPEDHFWIRVRGLPRDACVRIAEAFVDQETVEVLRTGDRPHFDSSTIAAGCGRGGTASVRITFRQG